MLLILTNMNVFAPLLQALDTESPVLSPAVTPEPQTVAHSSVPVPSPVATATVSVRTFNISYCVECINSVFYDYKVCSCIVFVIRLQAPEDLNCIGSGQRFCHWKTMPGFQRHC